MLGRAIKLFLQKLKGVLVIVTLKKNLDFARVFSRGKWVSGRFIVIYYFKNRFSINRIGISINKKVKSGVNRNRAKRVIREVYRLNGSKIKVGYDLVIYCKEQDVSFKYDDICKDFCYLIKKANLGEVNEDN